MVTLAAEDDKDEDEDDDDEEEISHREFAARKLQLLFFGIL